MKEPTPVSVSGDPTTRKPQRFGISPRGNGKFGRWILDSVGLPAYAYELDQYKEAKIARYPNSEGVDRRDHWHQIGNDQVTALAYNDGIIEVFVADRGGIFLNRSEVWDDAAPLSPIGLINKVLRLFLHWLDTWRARNLIQHWSKATPPRGDSKPTPPGSNLPFRPNSMPSLKVGTSPRNPEQTRYAFSGGYSYLDDGTESWATAYCYRPPNADTSRLFGMGYFETTMTYRNIRSTRRVYAPYGAISAVVIDETLENIGPSAVTLTHYEYWDVNIHPLKLQWFRTGLSAPIGDDERRELNLRFDATITETPGALRFHQSHQDRVPLVEDDEGVGRVDRTPPDVFLVDLSGQKSTAFTNKVDFFGDSGAAKPGAVAERRDPRPDAPLQKVMPYCMVLRHDAITLDAGQSITLRHAYGAVQPDEPLEAICAQLQDATLDETREQWNTHVVDFTTTDPAIDNDALQRETAWHAYNLLSSTLHSDYYDTHYVPQGSAYLFLHGADGAPRDQALFSLPLVYIRPDLARSTLKLLMRLTHSGTGALPYSFAGNGYHSPARDTHTEPSDLDLFFLLAIYEYIVATGHIAFLDEHVPFYGYPNDLPPHHPAFVDGDTVFDHIRCAVIHLMAMVGLGPNALIRIGDGDWSDGIVLTTLLGRKRPDLLLELEQTKKHGESVPNTQMALYVLPRIAALIEPRDPELARNITDWLPALKKAAQGQWHEKEAATEGWYIRAILRDARNSPLPIDVDRINLESQVWALISGLAAVEGKESILVDTIKQTLDDPSAVGAMMTQDGAVWPAISQLLTWGYSRNYQKLAWNSLKKNTFAAHAEQFPTRWNNIWTGPDGIDKSGWAWASVVTPMTDFPAMNANPDAMYLLALLRVCGVEPSACGDGLDIKPQTPPENFVLDTQLLRLAVAPGQISGEYRPIVDGSQVLHITLPGNPVSASIDGQMLTLPMQNQVDLHLNCISGIPIAFDIRWH